MQPQQLNQSSKVDYDPTAHENEPKKLSVGISIKNLTKIYDEVSSSSPCEIWHHFILYIIIILSTHGHMHIIQYLYTYHCLVVVISAVDHLCEGQNREGLLLFIVMLAFLQLIYTPVTDEP